MAGRKATGKRHLLPHPRGARPLDPAVPTFVDRDKGPEIRGWLGEARDMGGFLVLVGDSSVGKTRLLYEAASDVVPDFDVLAPDLGDGDLVNKIAEAAFPLPRLIVWLDELQRFLDGPYLTPGSTPITSGTIRRLLDAPTPVIILGTLWPAYALQLRATEPDPATRQQRPRYPNALDILTDRRLHYVPLDTFSPGEKKAAEQLASQDPRLAEAVADRDYGVTEFLAGAPELMRRYEQATEEQKAVLHAAIDARRVGIQAPLPGQLLREAARGYLSTVHPDDTWFGPALAELTSASRATAPLIPVLNADRSQVLGFTPADYLLQHLTRRRRSVRLPAVTWRALTDHTRDRDDLLRLGEAAGSRLLYSYAEFIYGHLAAAGDEYAAWRLADLLAGRGRADEALVGLLGVQGRLDDSIEVLRARAEAGDGKAADLLVAVLMVQGRGDEAIQVVQLQVSADAGDAYAAGMLAFLLAGQGREDELRARADGGDPLAASQLAELLAGQGQIDELRARADAGDGHAARLLGDLLAGQGQVDELRARADAGHGSAASRLAELLAEQGREDELRARADAGDRSAASRLAELLAEQGREDELRARADAGDRSAASRLAELLAEQGREDELRAEVDAGTPTAAEHLIAMLAEQGDTASADRIRRFGLNPDGSIADGNPGIQQSRPTAAS